MANGTTRSWTMCHLRKKTEALYIPLRHLPREASKGEAPGNREQALLGRQGSRTEGKGQESRQEVSRSISDALALQRFGFVAVAACFQLLLRWPQLVQNPDFTRWPRVSANKRRKLVPTPSFDIPVCPSLGASPETYRPSACRKALLGRLYLGSSITDPTPA